MAQKDLLDGNESLSKLKDKITNDEGDPKVLSPNDISTAIWLLADELEELQYLRKHRHTTKTIDVVE